MKCEGSSLKCRLQITVSSFSNSKSIHAMLGAARIKITEEF